MLRFLIWVMFQSGFSQKMEATVVISDRGDLMQKIGYAVMEKLRRQTARSLCCTQGSRARARDVTTRAPETKAMGWNLNQVGITKGGADERELEPEAQLLPEFLLKTEKGRKSLASPLLLPSGLLPVTPSWPHLSGSPLVREQENAVLCNKEQTRERSEWI